MPVPNVATGDTISEAWGDAVADSIAALEAAGVAARVQAIGALNAHDFGAVGDGVADDTAELQAALTAAAGKTLYLPAGTYLVTAPLLVTGQQTRLEAYGSGDSVTIKAGAAMAAVMVVADFEQYWHGITIEGNALAQAGVVLWNGRRSMFVKCKVKNVLADGWFGNLYWDGAFSGNNNMIGWYNCGANANGANGWHAAVIPLGGRDNNGWCWFDCTGTDNVRSGLLLDGYNAMVIGGQWDRNTRYGIEIGIAGSGYSPPQYNTLWHPWFEANTTGYGWAVFSGTNNTCYNAVGLQKFDHLASVSAALNANQEVLSSDGWEIRTFNSNKIHALGLRGGQINANNSTDPNHDVAVIPKGTGNLSTTRLSAAEATNLVTADFAFSGGWGNTAALSAVQGHDMAGRFTITSGGTGQAANPTVTLTYKGGAWGLSPIAIVMRRDRTSQPTVNFSWVENTGNLVMTFQGTPVAGEAYTVDFHVIGR